ncbi:MAG: amidase family protein [Chloroflexota bacterium]|nr:amidase family protein [Chloroflexota bacterium]
MGKTLGRRAFLGATMASGAALLADRLSSPADAAAPESAWLDASITQLQSLMATRRMSSVELTQAYLTRIAVKNPLLHAVIETNADALNIARERDAERRAGRVRGSLHGIPILLKDNIATADGMQTTAGSLALVGSRVPADAVVAARLRAAGAVILGKSNLSEWANFRGIPPLGFPNGWSARGGFTRNPYRLDLDPCGSSAGSGVAPAANLCAGAVGTETDGSVLCPAGENHIVGLKPTLGLISQKGIIPIAHSQDTAGPMARSVMDVAIMLNAMRSPFGAVAGEFSGQQYGDHGDLPADYTAFVRTGALRGARIGVDSWWTDDFGPGDAGISAVFESALAAMERAGATIVHFRSDDPTPYLDDELTVLLYEMKADMAAYLAPVRNTAMRTLTDLIAFNRAHCAEEMKYFGQEWFERSDATSGLSDPLYLAARANCVRLTRAEGIDRQMAERHLDALVAPTYSYGTAPAAIAGYPSMSVPFALTTDGHPAGVWMWAGFLQEPKLLALARDIERIRPARATPTFNGSVPTEPADAGLCGTSVAAPTRAATTARHHPRHF